MTQFGGSFRFVQLLAVAQLLAELRSTGRLCVTYAEWTGEIVVREGQIVAACLGAEHGRAALEGIAVALPDAEFSFTDEPVPDANEPLVTPSERTAYLDRLGAEHQRLVKVIPSLGVIPRLVDVADGNAADTQVTIGAAALQLIPSLVSGHSLEQIARQRGLVRTLREVADLVEGGLVKLDPKPSAVTQAPVVAQQVVEKPVRDEPAGDQPVGEGRPVGQRRSGDTSVGETVPVGKTGLDRSGPVLPVSARPFAARSAAAGRSVAVAAEESSQTAAVSRQMPPRLAVARHATPGTVNAQPPAVIPPGVAARLSAARNFAMEPLAPSPRRVNSGGWRKALMSFFLTDEPGT